MWYIHNTQKVDRCTNIHNIVIDKLPHKAAVITSMFTHFPIAGLHSPRFDSDIAPCFELVTPTNFKNMYQNETRRECLLAQNSTKINQPENIRKPMFSKKTCVSIWRIFHRFCLQLVVLLEKALQLLENTTPGAESRMFGWSNSWRIEDLNYRFLAKLKYFTNTDFPEIAGDSLTMSSFGGPGRVRSLEFDQMW